MLTNEAKKQILKCLLNYIADVADKEYQRRIWIRGEGPEVDDFDETVNHFFGGIHDILEKYKDFGITENQCRILKEFRDEFDTFCRGPALEYYLPQLFIDTPEWTRITLMAKEV